MPTIRTATIAVGSTATAGAQDIYTVPAGFHVAVRQVTLRSNAAQTLGWRGVRAGVGRYIAADIVLSAAGTAEWDIDHVLEAGDILRLVTGAAVGLTWWVSGTVYDE